MELAEACRGGEALAGKGFKSAKRPIVKILAQGELTKKFIVKVPCSAAAKAKIEAVGGSVAGKA
jgi:ribosomal protein L15